jgi:DNA-binding MarR family transcriptional regulator
MLALWEQDKVCIKELSDTLFLESGTLTPVLKKLETIGYITRTEITT